MTAADDRSKSTADPMGSIPTDINSDNALPLSPIQTAPKDDIPVTPAFSKSFRQQLGSELARVSDFINNNLIVVRYATVSTVLLLGAYGIANTPLFHRYKHVLDIPPQIFLKRKWIHGRIVGVVTEKERMIHRVGDRSSHSNSSRIPSGSNNNNEKANSLHYEHCPILVLFRHSSPIERLFTQSTMERLLASSHNKYASFSHHHNLLPIELAGISAPSTEIAKPSMMILSTSLTNKSEVHSPFPLLNQLIQQKAKVSLQLLARQSTPHDDTPIISVQRGNIDNNKLSINEDSIEHTAICHLHYHPPNSSSWFTSTNNASLEMVQSGQAWINPSGGVVPLLPLPSVGKQTTEQNNIRQHTTTATLSNYNPTVKQLKEDTQFLNQLEQAEYNAWKSRIGIWSSEDIRGLRAEYLAEEESRKTKWQFWSVVKRGWEWILRRR